MAGLAVVVPRPPDRRAVEREIGLAYEPARAPRRADGSPPTAAVDAMRHRARELPRAIQRRGAAAALHEAWGL